MNDLNKIYPLTTSKFDDKQTNFVLEKILDQERKYIPIDLARQYFEKILEEHQKAKQSYASKISLLREKFREFENFPRKVVVEQPRRLKSVRFADEDSAQKNSVAKPRQVDQCCRVLKTLVRIFTNWRDLFLGEY